MFRKFCVPVVNEPLSLAAAKAAMLLAKKLGARLLLTHLYTLPLLHLTQDPHEVRQELQATSLKFLESCLEFASNHAVDATILPLEVASSGEIAATIAKLAEDEHCDLIVLGTHAREGISRLLLGSVAEAVSRCSVLPVLLYREDTAKPFECENILVALDGFESGLSALETAHALSKQLPAALEVLHVVPDVFVYTEPMMPAFDTTRFENHLLEHGKHILYAAEASLEDLPNKHLLLEQAKGRRIADVILETARLNLADLIVLGTHGYTGLERLLLGSVAQAVAHHANVPVLLVRQTQLEKVTALVDFAPSNTSKSLS
jgi:nucleotide-binding universal stress UspA family protein